MSNETSVSNKCYRLCISSTHTAQIFLYFLKFKSIAQNKLAVFYRRAGWPILQHARQASFFHAAIGPIMLVHS